MVQNWSDSYSETVTTSWRLSPEGGTRAQVENGNVSVWILGDPEDLECTDVEVAFIEDTTLRCKVPVISSSVGGVELPVQVCVREADMPPDDWCSNEDVTMR